MWYAITLSFMLDFVEIHWADLADEVPDIGYLLARHLSSSFVMGADSIAQSLVEGSVAPRSSVIHPHRYYVVPARQGHTMGDVYRRASEAVNSQGDAAQNTDTQEVDAMFGETEFVVSLTPSCDLVGLDDQSTRKPKAEFVLMARCLTVADLSEFEPWTKDRSAEIAKLELTNAMRDVVRSQRQKWPSGQFYFLPRAWSIPDCLLICSNPSV